MHLFLVKKTIFYVFLISIISFNGNIAHFLLKNYNVSEKLFQVLPMSDLHLNEQYISFFSNLANSNTSKNITSENLFLKNLNFMEKYNRANEKNYIIISSSNESINKNHAHDADKKILVMQKVNNNFTNHTDFKLPLFVPYFIGDKFSNENYDNFLYNKYGKKRKTITPSFNKSNSSGYECGINNELVNIGIKNIKKSFNKTNLINEKVDKYSSDLNPLSRLAKFLGLFTIIQFTNEICTDGSNNMYGTCYNYVECNKLGGVAKGSCAKGHGVCCYVEQTCGHRTNANAAYFIGGSFFNTSERGVYGCSIVIDKSDPSVKQLRLDFVSFKLAGPLDGNCQIDRFIISGQNDNNILPEICGNNDGQHMYIDVDVAHGPFMLAVLSSGANGLPESFRIHVQQLREKSDLLAPSNCLQYHLTISGVIKSFNYQNNLSPVLKHGYMNELNYAICIKKQPGYCGITYSNRVNNGTEMVFELNNMDDEGMPTVPEGEAGAESYNCPDDYIVLNNMRLCGNRLNDASENSDLKQNHIVKVADNGPFVVSVKTNTNVTGRGFYLNYQQNPCIIN